jgi:hypothetical protein
MDGLSAVSLNMGFVHVSTSAHLYLTEMRGGNIKRLFKFELIFY